MAERAYKLEWLLGLEKETLANMVLQQSKVIEKLQQAVKAQAVPQWISVSERMPEKRTGEKILGFNGEYVFECECDSDGYWCNLGGDTFTHWMPTPDLPIPSKGGE